MSNKCLSFDEAKSLLEGGLAKAFFDTATSYSIPVYWERSDNRHPLLIGNGTGFLLDTGVKTFFVTANHVFEGYRTAKNQYSDTICVLNETIFDLEDRYISSDPIYDVATFMVDKNDIASLKRQGKIVLTGCDSYCNLRTSSDETFLQNPQEITIAKNIEGIKIFYQSATDKREILICDNELSTILESICFNNDIIIRNEKSELIYNSIYSRIKAVGGKISFRWPPNPPTKHKGVFFVGFPGIARKIMPYTGMGLVKTDWNGYASLTIVDSVSNTDIVLLLEPNPNHIAIEPKFIYDLNLGGCSGAPILTLVDDQGIYSWRLGGIIVEAPSKNIEHSSNMQEPIKLIKASLADCINDDGTINRFPNNEMYNKH